MGARATDASPLDGDLARHLEHLRVERRLAERSLVSYRDAFERLQRAATRAMAAASPPACAGSAASTRSSSSCKSRSVRR